jgi:sorting nexin-25
MTSQLAHDGSNRKVRDTVSSFLDEMHVMNFIGMFRDTLWPGGQFRPPPTPRSAEEKARARDDANRMLSALIPGTLFVFRCGVLS